MLSVDDTLLSVIVARLIFVGEIKMKPKRQCLQDKAMCSPIAEEYLSWKRKIIEQAEAAINGRKAKKPRTR